MILLDCLYGMHRVKHYYIDDVKVRAPGRVELRSAQPHFAFLQQRIQVGSTRIGIPVPGIAHRHGPGALSVINYCDQVRISNVEVWSAPWFAFQILRNTGPVTLQKVNVRPKPGSGKILASCRDAVHVKGNRGKLLFENCILRGLGDDAFNISTHCSRVRKVISPTQLLIRQQFPIQFIPLSAGDTLLVMSAKTSEVIGHSRLTSVEVLLTEQSGESEEMACVKNQFRGRAPTLRLTLASPIAGLEKEQVVSARETCNPQSVVRGCTIRRSCRFQSSLLLEDCDVEAFLTFYGDALEGPGPEHVAIRRCTLKSASWNETLETAVSFSGFEGSDQRQLTWRMNSQNMLLRHASLIDNDIWGRLQLNLAQCLVLRGNRFYYERDDPLRIENVMALERSDNTFGKQPPTAVPSTSR